MAQTLETLILINATVGSGFGQVGSVLSQLGQMVDQLSSKLIDFGKESLDVYKDYEKSMAEAEVALSTQYGRGTKELGDAMTQLNSAAAEWASTTIFHTNDVANAISEAAHAGWDLNQILNGMPIAMQVAQAGSMDLSTSLDYLLKSTNALGVPYEQLGDFADMWVFTANSSAANVQEFGETMLKLGSTMRFADGQKELFTMIGMMAQMGTTGTEAATMIRTAMMNLLAPSGIASKTLEMLGATDEELQAIRTDSSKVEALEKLQEHGFSAFDAQGQAKPILDIYQSLGDALADIAGGYELIGKNETTLGIMGTVFGKRGVTGAMNFINAMNWAHEEMERLNNGEYIGYGEYAQETMMDTYYGAVETYESKVEELQRRTGERLAEQLEPVIDRAGSLVDTISGLDTANFNALVSGLEVIAAAGPGLLLTGGALTGISGLIKFFSKDPLLYGGIAATAAAVVGIADAMAVLHEFEEADYLSNFGNLNLDNSAITSYAKGITDDFTEANAQIAAFQEALTQSVQSYQTASADFKSGLLTNMLTGAELTEGSAEYQKLTNLGNQMVEAIKTGVENSHAFAMQNVSDVFGEDMDAGEAQGFAAIIEAINADFEAAVAETEAIAQRFADALKNALSDGSIDAGDLDNLRSVMDEMNSIMAQQAEVEAYVNQQSALRKAQSLGLEGVEESAKILKDANDALLETKLQQNDATFKKTSLDLDKEVARGKISSDEAEAYKQMLAQKQTDYAYSQTAMLNKPIYDMFNELAADNEISGAWQSLQALGDDLREAGGVVTPEAAKRFSSSVNAKDAEAATRTLDTMIDWMGGYDQIREYADYFERSGDLESAREYRQVLDMYDAMGGGGKAVSPQIGARGESGGIAGTYEQMAALLQGAGTMLTPEGLSQYMHQAQEQWQMQPDWYNTLGESLYDQMTGAALNAGFKDIGEWVSALEKAYPGMTSSQQPDQENQPPTAAQEPAEISPTADQTATVQAELDASAVNTDAISEAAGTVTLDAELKTEGDLSEVLPEGEAVEVAATPVLEGDIEDLVAGETVELPVELNMDSMDALQQMGVHVQVDGDTTALDASIKAEDGQQILAVIDGDVSAVDAQITSLDGQPIQTIINGDISQVEAALNALGGQEVLLHMEYDTSGALESQEGLQDQSVQVQVEGDTAELSSAIEAEDGQSLMAEVGGDTGELNSAIMAEDGQSLTAHVNGDVSALAAAISSQDGRSITVHVNYVSSGAPKGYAEGGRATEPSIFGEAGPEWAIPEEHSERTAELLDAAREASGFTWPDLLSRFGGLNADVNHQTTTLVYSPTINVQDASGVEEALIEDKRRLQKWFDERKLRDEVEVYS